MGYVKQITAYLDIWKKFLQTIFIIVPILGSVAAAGTWTFKKVYHKEIQEWQEVYTFMKLAQDSILPSSYRKHSFLQNSIEKLESKHNGNFAIGLRWDEDQQKVMYRGKDKVLREAHRNPVDGSWYYIKDGQAAYVYE